MIRRVLFVTLTLALSGGIVVSAGESQAFQTVITPMLPSAFPNGLVPIWGTARGTPFGTPCRICSKDVIQGGIGDCFLLAALGAIAAVSPGTIQNAIVDDGADLAGHEVYTVRLYGQNKPTYTVNNTFPAVPPPPSLLQRFNDIYLTGQYLESYTQRQPAFAYAQPAYRSGYSQIVGSNASIWPMIIEKAYAARLRAGYTQPEFQNGGYAYLAMQTITGKSGGFWRIDPKGVPNLLQSVWIHDSPASPNTGEHSIIAGLLLGDIHAVEPNLQICVTPPGSRYGPCTPICHESHQCRQRFSAGGVRLDPKNPKAHFLVLDIDRPGSQRTVAEFDLNPADCTTDHPCTVNTSTGPLIISFTMNGQNSLNDEAAKTMTTAAELDIFFTQAVSAHKPVVAGTVLTCDQGSCTKWFPSKLELGHAYILQDYNSATRVVSLIDPHGPVQSVPIDDFLDTFTEVDYSDSPPVAAVNCGCK
jgi:hypothetical protein